MPMVVGQIKDMVLGRENIMNHVEGIALRNMSTMTICNFLLENLICHYICVRKVVENRGELNANEARELFNRLGVKISLTTTYNMKANEKIERGHTFIVHTRSGICLLPYTL